MADLLLQDPALWVDCEAILGPRALDAYLPQTGRFRMLEGVLQAATEDRPIVGFKDIRADDWWAADHLPGRPIFPGVLQCELAAQLCTVDILTRQLRGVDLGQSFVGFGGIDAVRFRQAILPQGRLLVAARLLKGSRRLWRYHAQGTYKGRLAFEGEITGVLF